MQCRQTGSERDGEAIISESGTFQRSAPGDAIAASVAFAQKRMAIGMRHNSKQFTVSTSDDSKHVSHTWCGRSLHPAQPPLLGFHYIVSPLVFCLYLLTGQSLTSVLYAIKSSHIIAKLREWSRTREINTRLDMYLLLFLEYAPETRGLLRF